MNITITRVHGSMSNIYVRVDGVEFALPYIVDDLFFSSEEGEKTHTKTERAVVACNKVVINCRIESFYENKKVVCRRAFIGALKCIVSSLEYDDVSLELRKMGLSRPHLYANREIHAAIKLLAHIAPEEVSEKAKKITEEDIYKKTWYRNVLYWMSDHGLNEYDTVYGN